MKRFMKFKSIIEEVETGLVQAGLIIKCVATDETLLLNEFILDKSDVRVKAFCTEDRRIVQTVDPESVWELVNIEFEGDVVNEQQ